MISQLPTNVRVKLVIPPEHLHKVKYHATHGEHLAYHAQAGTLICGVGKDGAYVHFDKDTEKQPNRYVGCPLAWLERAA